MRLNTNITQILPELTLLSCYDSSEKLFDCYFSCSIILGPLDTHFLSQLRQTCSRSTRQYLKYHFKFQSTLPPHSLVPLLLSIFELKWSNERMLCSGFVYHHIFMYLWTEYNTSDPQEVHKKGHKVHTCKFKTLCQHKVEELSCRASNR